MVELIALIVFLASAGALAIMLYRKAPALAALPKDGHHGLKKPELVSKIEKRIKENHFHFFEKQMLLHKLLSKTKVWILKIESKIDALLQRVRMRSQEVEKKRKKKS